MTPPQPQAYHEICYLGALGEFRTILGEALGIRNSILGIRKSILRMASHDLSNTKTTILGATPGAIPGIDGNPHVSRSWEYSRILPDFGRNLTDFAGWAAASQTLCGHDVFGRTHFRCTLTRPVEHERFSFASTLLERLDGPKWQSPIASQRTRPSLAGHSAVPLETSTTPMNANRAYSNRSATNAGPMRTKSCIFRGNYERQRALAIRIAAETLATA